MTAAAATHTELAHLIARGERKHAASLLVRDHAPAVLALCRAMVRDPRLAEDLSQDAFARAFGALDGFRGEASPRTWLLKIARNRCLDHLDRARRTPWAGDSDPEPDDHAADELPPYDLLARREDAERAMAVLGESERALVVLHFGHGVGYPELADSFGLREGTVRMRISRALARMRAALAAELDRARDDFELEVATPALSERAVSAVARSRFEARTSIGAAAELDDDLADDAEGAMAADRAGAAAPTLDLESDLDLEEGADLEVGAAPGLELELVTPLDEVSPIFSSLCDEVPPALGRRLDALVAAV